MTERGTAVEIAERKAGSTVIVSLDGRLDGHGAPDLEATVLAIVERGDVRVVLDCSSLRYISSFGLRALLVCARNCRKQGGKLAIAALQPDCQSVVEMSGLLSMIEWHDTTEAAFATPDRASSHGGNNRSVPKNTAGMAFEERIAGPAVVVSLNGRLDGHSAPHLESVVCAVIGRGCVRTVLDCGRMTYVSSSGLRALLLSAGSCRQESGKLVIAALHAECRSTLQMSGFPSVIDCYDTTEAALAALA